MSDINSSDNKIEEENRTPPLVKGGTRVDKRWRAPGEPDRTGNYYSNNPGLERKRVRGDIGFKDNSGKYRKITLLQKSFADAYLACGGSGKAAWLAVYPKGTRHKEASRNREIRNFLMNPNVAAYITLNLEKSGFSEANVQAQHLFLLNQFGDLRVKMSAVDAFYKLQGLYAQDSTVKLDEELASALNKMTDILREGVNKEDDKPKELPPPSEG